MQAAVIRDFGPPSVLRVEQVDAPRPRSGWTTVRLRAAALNWHDALVRRGTYPSVGLPHILGADGAGISDENDEVAILPSLWWGESDRHPGPDFQILGDEIPGTYAELVRVPSSSVFPRPRGWSWAETAGLALAGVTAYRALFVRAGLRAKESLLVLGAGGGLSPMAVRLAVAAGAKVVVTSGCAEKIDRAVELGATAGVLYTDPDWVAHAREHSHNGKGFDVILDGVGSWSESLSAACPGGRVVVVGSKRATRQELDARAFYFGQYDLLGSTMGSARDLAGLLRLVESGDLRPVPTDRHYSLDHAAEAHTFLESGDAFGKIVLTIP